MQVLGADRHVGLTRLFHRDRQIHEGRADNNLITIVSSDEGKEVAEKALGLVG